MVNKRLVSTIIGVVFVFAATGSVCGVLTEILDIQFELSGDDGNGSTVFTSSGFSILDISGLSNPTGVNGQLRAAGDGTTYNYQIRGATFELETSALNYDYSVPDPMGIFPGEEIAKGSFSGGSTLTMTGSIYHKNGTPICANTTLLVATVSGDWAAEEQWPSLMPGQSALNFQLNYAVTGGELTTGALSGFYVNNGMQMQGALQNVTQDGQPGVDLRNFEGGDIHYAQPSTLHMYPVIIPEPCTVVLLGLGGLMMRRKKK